MKCRNVRPQRYRIEHKPTYPYGISGDWLASGLFVRFAHVRDIISMLIHDKSKTIWFQCSITQFSIGVLEFNSLKGEELHVKTQSLSINTTMYFLSVLLLSALSV